jgi:hypothetical protein
MTTQQAHTQKKNAQYAVAVGDDERVAHSILPLDTPGRFPPLHELGRRRIAQVVHGNTRVL